MKLIFVLGAFIIVALLLFLNHWGFAIRVTNWIFYLLTIITLWKLAHVEKN